MICWTRTRRLLAVVVVGAGVATSVPAGNAAAFSTVVFNGAGLAPRIGIIGDSANAGIRWTGSFAPLRRFNFVYDAESCRRTIAVSCRGREGYAPENAITTLRRLSGQWGSVLVMATGYNDPGTSFGSAVDAVMAEAARQGIPTVMWLTMRTADVSYVSPEYRTNSTTFRDNNRVLLQRAGQYGGRLVVADWATYSAAHPEWFNPDGIHYRPVGAWAAAEFIATQASRALAGGAGALLTSRGGVRAWTTLRTGSRGSAVVAVQQALIAAGYSLYGGADGAFGARTEAAVRRFQGANGLPVTGAVDANTAIRLGVYQPGGIPTTTGWTELRLNMGGRAVAEAQQALIDRRINLPGGATGSFGASTYYAVQTFQRMNGLFVSGRIDAATARRLGLFSGSWTTVRQGMSGATVRRAQQALIDRGIAVQEGTSGTFALGTYYAVQTYQRWQGLPVTGVIDHETARRLGLLVAPATTDVWTKLSNGLVSTNVERAQRALMNRGVYVRGGATGHFDVYTYYAVQTFQRYNGLPVTGVVDVATAVKLGMFDPADFTMGWTDLRLWSVGPNVVRAQQELMSRGVRVVGGASGRFDKYTYYAVQTFQRYNGLRVTGVIDVATALRLGLFGSDTTLVATSLAASAPVPVVATSVTMPPTTTTTTTTTTTSTTSTTTTSTAPPTTATTLAPATVALGDLVWLDADLDGLQDEDESGVRGVVVRAFDVAGHEVGATVTDELGGYRFEVTPGSYQVEVDLPVDLTMTTSLVGTDPTADSDAVALDDDARTARTDWVAVAPGFAVDSVDIGLLPGSGGASSSSPPGATSTSTPSSTTLPPTVPTTTGPETTRPPIVTEPTTTEPAITSTTTATTPPSAPATDPATTSPSTTD